MKFLLAYLMCNCAISLTYSFSLQYSRTSSLRSRSLFMKDYPKPNVENTDNYREASKLSAKFATLNGKGPSKKVAIIGGGLSGLACARYLVDAGNTTF